LDTFLFVAKRLLSRVRLVEIDYILESV
jgi:hypothetical protein